MKEENIKFKLIIKRTINAILKIDFIKKVLNNLSFHGSKKYWETRYVSGRNSGDGSYGELSIFKANILNSFVKKNGIYSIIEFGCGDGNQLSLFNFNNYIGLDISQTAIKMCNEKFKNDKTKKFFLYDSEYLSSNKKEFKADLSLSLDVIYHLVEDNVFDSYMKQLFSSSNKYVIIYSSNIDINATFQNPHVKQRQFSKWIEKNEPQWVFIEKIENEYPNDSISDFYIYKKQLRHI